ncbi:Uncharacterised protein [Mycobacterium tuberculosis]|nr:Uncharacterised protein [Mycobacterium tuberculosis]
MLSVEAASVFGADPAGPGAPLGVAALGEMRGCGTGWGYGEGAAADQPCSTGGARTVAKHTTHR